MSGAASAEVEESGPAVDLPGLLARAEAANPEILAAKARLGAMQHLPSQMEASPDPVAGVSYTNESLDAFTLGESPDSNLAFSWSQEVPYPGKLRLAGDVARAEADVAGRALELARRRVRFEVTSVYADLLRLDRTARILTESRALLTSLQGTARARYESGEAILENVLKAQTELMKLDVRLAAIAHDRRAAAVALNALIGRSEDAPTGAVLEVPRARMPALDEVENASLEASPELGLLRASRTRDENRVQLAKKNLKPDFMWSAAYMNRGGLDPMVSGGFGVRLPIHRRSKQAEGLAQAELDLEAARREVEAAERKTLARAREIVSLAERAETILELYDEGIIPQARGALEAAEAAYSVGRADFLTLLTDFLAILDYEIDREGQTVERLKALAALEQITGAELVLAAEVEEEEGGTRE